LRGSPSNIRENTAQQRQKGNIPKRSAAKNLLGRFTISSCAGRDINKPQPAVGGPQPHQEKPVRESSK